MSKLAAPPARGRPQVVTTAEALESPLPAEIQEALGGLVGIAREGLLALSVGLGLSVVHQLMEREVTEVVGPKGKHNRDRTAKRHGREDGSMTLGGRRVPVSRPRMRTADDEHEVPVASYEYFADRDPLTRKALREAVRDVFGQHALVHRCHRHKERNVCDLLPERDRPMILVGIRGPWALTDRHLARERLELLASELDQTWPDAAASLREGIDDTLTLMRLGITGQLAKTLSSTNPIESMIEIVRHTQRNVKR
jgi:hypothetical protein